MARHQPPQSESASQWTPGGAPVRFPGFDVMDQRPHWDEVTASVVTARLGPRQPLVFFTESEEAVLRAFLDVLLDQTSEPRVPVAEMLDARLAEGSTDGWRYAGMPHDPQAWKASLAGLDEDAGAAYGTGFAALPTADQVSVVAAVQHATGRWHGMPSAQVWSLWTRYACTAFYSHPLAWNEIGFSGPAYPRGYKNAGVGRREPWEVRDHLDIDPVAGTS